MGWQDRLIASSTCWSDFWERAKMLPSDGKRGEAFERLTQLYLQTTPEYRAELRHVWALREVPPHVCKRLDLPPRDEGIDLIACTRHGEYWAIQSKFRSQRDTSLTCHARSPSARAIVSVRAAYEASRLTKVGNSWRLLIAPVL